MAEDQRPWARTRTAQTRGRADHPPAGERPVAMAEDQRTRARTRNSQKKGRVDHPSAEERPEAPRRSGGYRAAPRTPDAQGVCPAPRNLGRKVAAGERADLGGNSPRVALRCGNRRVRRGPMLTWKSHRSPLTAYFSFQCQHADFPIVDNTARGRTRARARARASARCTLRQ